MPVSQPPIQTVWAPEECIKICDNLAEISKKNTVTGVEGLRCTREVTNAMHDCKECYESSDITFASTLFAEFDIQEIFAHCLEDLSPGDVATSITLLEFATAATKEWTKLISQTEQGGLAYYNEIEGIVADQEHVATTLVRDDTVAPTSNGETSETSESRVTETRYIESSKPSQTDAIETAVPAQQSAPSNNVWIAGAVLGPVFVILAVGVFIIFHWRSRRRDQNNSAGPSPAAAVEIGAASPQVEAEKHMLHSDCVPPPHAYHLNSPRPSTTPTVFSDYYSSGLNMNHGPATASHHHSRNMSADQTSEHQYARDSSQVGSSITTGGYWRGSSRSTANFYGSLSTPQPGTPDLIVPVEMPTGTEENVHPR